MKRRILLFVIVLTVMLALRALACRSPLCWE